MPAPSRSPQPVGPVRFVHFGTKYTIVLVVTRNIGLVIYGTNTDSFGPIKGLSGIN
jgi:hypothetical protein